MSRHADDGHPLQQTDCVLRFTVDGIPQAKGSIRAFMPEGALQPVLTSTNKKLKAWERDIAKAAQEAMRRLPDFARLDSGPVTLSVCFAMKSNPGKALAIKNIGNQKA